MGMAVSGFFRRGMDELGDFQRFEFFVIQVPVDVGPVHDQGNIRDEFPGRGGIDPPGFQRVIIFLFEQISPVGRFGAGGLEASAGWTGKSFFSSATA